MKHFFKKFVSLFFLFTSAIASEPSDELIQLLNNIHTMQANFNQTVSDTKGKILNRSQGQMSLQRPGKFRWDVLRPNRQLIITDGRKLWVYDVDLEQVTVRHFSHEAGEAPALLLSDTNTKLAEDFNVRAVNHTFILTPKDKSSMFESIKLGFVNQQIRDMQLQDHLGHVTSIQFNHVIINTSLSPTLFNFKAPAKVDVIDETRR